MVPEDAATLRARVKRAGISLRDTLSVIDMTLDDHMAGRGVHSPQQMFAGLNRLIDRTVHGTRIEHVAPGKGTSPFHTFQIHTGRNEVLGHLNMIYLRKPVPCYYLLYVEVMPSFRGRGLGNMIMKAFMEFVKSRGAVGLLDNIIPSDEPTYEMYIKLGWRRVIDVIGGRELGENGNYMVLVPTSLGSPSLKVQLIRVLARLGKKRPVIEMHDNEQMVKRTIDELRSVYRALEDIFEEEIACGVSTPLMRFMFTKFVTKFLGFRSRIATLLGYTGGESLEQLAISDRIKALPMQAYSLWTPTGEHSGTWGEEGLQRSLPAELTRNPTAFIEALPLYDRPYLCEWLKRGEDRTCARFTLADCLELGFDPTKLREFRHEGVEYIFERSSSHDGGSVEKRVRFLSQAREEVSGLRFNGTSVKTMPPLVLLRDKGNTYVLRKKVKGIHAQEALDQIRSAPHLDGLNRALEIDRLTVHVITCIKECLIARLGKTFREEIEELTYFVPWDIEKNRPQLQVDISKVGLATIWLA